MKRFLLLMIVACVVGLSARIAFRVFNIDPAAMAAQSR